MVYGYACRSFSKYMRTISLPLLFMWLPVLKLCVSIEIKVHTGWLTNSIGYMVCSFCQWWMVRVKRSSCFRMYLTRLYQRIPMTFLMSPRHGSVSFSHALNWRIFLHISSSFLFVKCLRVLHVAWLLLGAVFHSFHCRTYRPPTKHVSE
jgi:hypothetical protein